MLIKAQALNPLVKIVVDTEHLSEKKAKFFQAFTIVVGTGLKFDSIIKINSICRENNIQFIYGDVCGMFAFSVLDLQDHDYYE